MSLFPDIDQSAVLNLDTTQAADTIAAGFVYDHEAGHFVLVDGSPRQVTGAEAVREWIGMMLRVRRGLDEVFSGLSTTPGIDRDGLIGSRSLPAGFQRSELMREIRETLALCPTIQSSDGFSFRRAGRALEISFTVTLRTGETLEVSELVG
ncbi:MAG: DUF2634 domain-containing protein [Clostridiales bacterium]|nr:DUF2634 domain-containing protein [Clostridiales bacterium]